MTDFNRESDAARYAETSRRPAPAAGNPAPWIVGAIIVLLIIGGAWYALSHSTMGSTSVTDRATSTPTIASPTPGAAPATAPTNAPKP